ncbi:hypothetical protein VULLAG_LOCUS18170 [Vulpes lagopus]
MMKQGGTTTLGAARPPALESAPHSNYHSLPLRTGLDAPGQRGGAPAAGESSLSCALLASACPGEYRMVSCVPSVPWDPGPCVGGTVHGARLLKGAGHRHLHPEPPTKLTGFSQMPCQVPTPALY